MFVPCGAWKPSGIRKLIVDFRNFANAHKTHHSVLKSLKRKYCTNNNSSSSNNNNNKTLMFSVFH